MRNGFSRLLLIAPLLAATSALMAQSSGQSLADLARKERERKKNEPPPKAVYTGEGAPVSYVGCYQDRSIRDLDGASFIALDMTNDLCQTYCLKKGFKYAGSQFGSQCYCSNSYGKYGQLDDAKCNSNCPGKQTEKCGGAWANTIYYLAGGDKGAGSGGSGESDAAGNAAQAAPPSADADTTFSVRLSPAQNTVKAGSGVWVSFVVTNVSRHNIRAATFGDDLQYQIQDASGHPVQHARHKDRYGRTVIVNYQPPEHPAMTDLQPGKTVKGQLSLSSYYDFTQAGQYSIQASRKDPEGNEVRVSNTVTVTVSR